MGCVMPEILDPIRSPKSNHIPKLGVGKLPPNLSRKGDLECTKQYRQLGNIVKMQQAPKYLRRSTLHIETNPESSMNGRVVIGTQQVRKD